VLITAKMSLNDSAACTSNKLALSSKNFLPEYTLHLMNRSAEEQPR
jgi:hypothetical protein